MPLGADDEQAARPAHLLRLVGDLGLILLQQGGVPRPHVQDLLVVRLGVGIRLGQQLILHALLAQRVLGQVLGVAAQHDVRAAAGHVGGDGDGPQLARLGHDLGLQLMVLGVEHAVGDALPL